VTDRFAVLASPVLVITTVSCADRAPLKISPNWTGSPEVVPRDATRFANPGILANTFICSPSVVVTVKTCQPAADAPVGVYVSFNVHNWPFGRVPTIQGEVAPPTMPSIERVSPASLEVTLASPNVPPDVSVTGAPTACNASVAV
jgi:hypothetical protein